MKTLLTLLFIFGMLAGSTAQEKKETSFDLKPFASSSGHWYGIKDKNNVIDPQPGQKRYKPSQIAEIADNILLYQRSNGGWPKNYDMRAVLTQSQAQKLKKAKKSLHTTFDNGTTYTQVEYLAQVYSVTHTEKYREAAISGFRFILEAQYPSGGWPQYYPLEDNYSRHITFNDGAYIGIMQLLKKVADDDPVYDFLDKDLQSKLIAAYQKGIRCILECQIEENGRLTAWCQQHDATSLNPAWARAFEPPSICNGESAAIVEFLMEIEHPDPKLIDAIQAAVKWFEASKIFNTREEWFDAPKQETPYTTITKDKRVVIDSTAAPIWTRYYELETERPLFCDRNSKFLYSLEEVSRERRVGYGWYTYEPQLVLDAYPAWIGKNEIEKNVLKQ